MGQCNTEYQHQSQFRAFQMGLLRLRHYEHEHKPKAQSLSFWGLFSGFGSVGFFLFSFKICIVKPLLSSMLLWHPSSHQLSAMLKVRFTGGFISLILLIGRHLTFKSSFSMVYLGSGLWNSTVLDPHLRKQVILQEHPGLSIPIIAPDKSVQNWGWCQFRFPDYTYSKL